MIYIMKFRLIVPDNHSSGIVLEIRKPLFIV